MTKRFREILMNNLGIKISSLILALAVYAHVFSKEEREVDFQIPITLQGLPEGLTYHGHVPEKIRIRVRARGSELFKLRTQLPHVVIPLSDARPGMLQRPVTTEDVVLPSGSGAQVKEIVDQTVLSLEIEPVVMKKVPVRIAIRGSPRPGTVRYGAVSVDPESLEVQGGESLVSPIDSLLTEEVDLADRSQTVEGSVAVEVPDGVQASAERVAIRVPIEPLARRRMGPIGVRLPPSLRQVWTTEPESVSVVLEGPISLVGRVGTAGIEVRAIPTPPILEEQDNVELKLSLDPNLESNLRSVGADPPTVRLVRRAR